MSISVKGISLENEIKKIDEIVRDFYYAPDPLHARDYEKTLSANAQDTDNKVVEDLLTEYFQTDELLRKNTDLKTVLAKVTLLNSHYRTVIKNIDLMAISRHILSIPKLDQRLSDDKPDLKLVEEIAYGQNEFKTKNVNNIYSFASKYCAWHQPDKYPIVDSYTKGMLYYINKDTNFFEKKLNEIKLNNKKLINEKLIDEIFIDEIFKERVFKQKKFTQKDLDDYSMYYVIYNFFIDYLKDFDIEKKSYKEIDIFLWRFGSLHNIKL